MHLGRRGAWSVRQFDLIVVALAVASLFAVLLSDVRLVQFSGSLPLALHRYYIVAAALGWLFGNVYVTRSRSAGSRLMLLVIYGLGPIPFLFLLRAMAPATAREVAPLVPLFASGMFLVFFVVPVSLRAPARVRMRIDHEKARKSSRLNETAPEDSSSSAPGGDSDENALEPSAREGAGEQPAER